MKNFYVLIFSVLIFSAQSIMLKAQSGIPDISLNGTGVVNVGGNKVIVQPDGKILTVSGIGSFLDFDYAINRYNVNGSPDASFGAGGQAVVSVGLSDVQEYENALGMVGIAIQADGKIVVAGNATNNRIIISRLNENGTLDNTFGTSGVTYFSFEENSALSFGGVKTHNNTIFIGGTVFGRYLRSIFIVKLNEAGILETGFSSDGIYSNPEDTEDEFFENKTHWEYANMAVETGGKIVVSANLFQEEEIGGEGSSFDIFRLNTNGTVDPSLNAKPSMPSVLHKGTSGLALQSDGRVIHSVHYQEDGVYKFYIGRLNPNGSPDDNFIGDPDWIGQFADIAIQTDGKILVASSSFHIDSDFVIRKFNTDGSFDTDFNDDGVLVLPGSRWKYSMTLQNDNQVLSLGPNNLRRFTNTISTPLSYQNRTVAYGAEPFELEPNSPSQGAITYSVQSGDAVTIDPSTGAINIQKVGSVVISAFQEQWGGYLPATATANLTISKGTLTATADNKSVEYGKDIPELTISYDGFAYGDDASSLTQAPAISTTATSSSDVGTYPITLTGGSAENYNITLVNGTLTITRTLQTFTFTPPQDQVFGTDPINLEATASSGLPVTFEVVSGPANIAGNVLTLTGPGTVVIKLIQAGNNDFEPHSAQFSFCSNPPVPTITRDSNNDLILTSSSPVGNQWLRNGEVIEGATSRNFEAIMPGSYTVRVTVGECSSTSEPTGIVTSVDDDLLEESVLSLQPNPTEQHLQVSFKGNAAGSTSAAIYNVQGLLLKKKDLTPAGNLLQADFDVQSLPSGVYVVYIESNNDVFVKKFMKR